MKPNETINSNINHNGRKLLSRRDAVIVAAVLLAAVLWTLLPGITKQSGAQAVIVCGDHEAARIPLDADGEYTFPETGSMVFTVADGAICVSDSDCGDRTCVRTGKIASAGEAIVCVPNRVSVTVEGVSPESDLDVVLK